MIDDDDYPDDEGVNPFSPSGVLADPGPVTSYQTPPDPWANPAPVLSPDQYVINILQRASKCRRGLALKPHISAYDGVQYGPPMLLQAEAIDLYLLNGVGQLTIEQMDAVLTALEEPEAGAPLAGTAAEQTAWAREKKRQADVLRQQKWYAERAVTRGRR